MILLRLSCCPSPDSLKITPRYTTTNCPAHQHRPYTLHTRIEMTDLLGKREDSGDTKHPDTRTARRKDRS